MVLLYVKALVLQFCYFKATREVVSSSLFKYAY